MALQIKIPKGIFSNSQEVTLNNIQYTIKNYYNDRDNAWRLDLIDGEGNNILLGLKVMPNQNLTGKYLRTGFSEGNLWCIRTILSDTSAIGLENFGTDLNYQIWYLTNQEEEDLGINIR